MTVARAALGTCPRLVSKRRDKRLGPQARSLRPTLSCYRHPRSRRRLSLRLTVALRDAVS